VVVLLSVVGGGRKGERNNTGQKAYDDLLRGGGKKEGGKGKRNLTCILCLREGDNLLLLDNVEERVSFAVSEGEGGKVGG